MRSSIRSSSAAAQLSDELIEGIVVDIIEATRGEVVPALRGRLSEGGELGGLLGLFALQ